MISAPLDWPLYHGVATTKSVPLPYHVAINGVPYLLNFQYEPFRREAFRHRSLPLMRAQADIGGSGISTLNNLPAEASLNPDGLWRRSQDNFWIGAGQMYLDRKDSNPDMFRSSKGINPWNHWQLRLQNDVTQVYSSPGTKPLVLVVGGYIYWATNNSLSWSTTPSGARTTVFVGTAISSICTDGTNIWFTVGALGIYTTTAGSGAAATQYVTSGLDTDAIVAYVKGRLMVANQNSVYNVIIGGALPTALFSQANTAFRWVAFSEGINQIYMAGFAGTSSIIYGTQVIPDGTALGAPVIYGQLPAGETVTSMIGYLGFSLVGSTLGIRFATADSSGNLTLGALIAIASPVYCFTPYDRFVWFGWSNYDSASTGIGRMDLVNFSQPNAPAYASDLMAPGSGTVTSVANFNGTVIFGVSGDGFFSQASTYVSQGTWQSGLITYDVADYKSAVFLDLQFAPPASGTDIMCSLSLDGGAFQNCGAVSGVTPNGFQEFSTPQSQASTFEVQLTLSTTTPANTPVLYRHTLRSLVAAPSVTEIIAPLLMQTELNIGDANYQSQTPSAQRNYLETLRQQRRIVTYQEGNQTYTVTIEAIDWLPDHPGEPNPWSGEFDGTLVLTLHTIV